MFEINTFEIGLLVVFILCLWNGAFKKYSTTLVFLILIFGKQLTQYWSFTQKQTELQRLITQRIWVEGSILFAEKKQDHWWIILSDIKIKHLGIRHDKLLLKVLDTRKRNLYRNRKILISGNLKKVSTQNRELHMVLSNIRTQSLLPRQTTFDYHWESLRLQLANRAKFYLSENSIQLYLPLILGVKSYGEIYSLFRNLGLSHLLVVSGLHTGLFFFGVRYIVIWLSSWLPFLLVSSFRRVVQDASSFLILLTYVTLLGFPAPALRATIGIGVFILTRYSGIAINPLHALATVATFFLLWNPQWVDNLSFQLSFVATAGLLMFRKLYISTQDTPFYHCILISGINSILASAGVLLAISPLLIKVFTNISIAPLFLNMLMTPLLAFFVLPVCFIAMLVSFLFLSSKPMSWLETNIFAVANWTLEKWGNILQNFGHEQSYILQTDNEWDSWEYIAYYSFLALFMLVVRWFTYKRISPNFREI